MTERLTVKVIEEDPDRLKEIIQGIKTEDQIEKIKGIYINSAIIELTKIDSSNKYPQFFFVPSSIRRLHSLEKAKFMVHSSEFCYKDQEKGELDINIVCSLDGNKMYSYCLIPPEQRGVFGTIALFSREQLVNVSIKLIGSYFTFTISRKYCDFDLMENAAVVEKIIWKGEGEKDYESCPGKYLEALLAGTKKATDKRIQFRYGNFNKC